MGHRKVLGGLVLILAPLVFAADPDEQAGKLYDEYRVAKRKGNEPAIFRIVRRFGGLDAGRSRDALLKIIKTSRSNDECVIACDALGKIADANAARAWLAAMAKKGDDLMAEALAGGLARVKDEGARSWLAGEAFKNAKPHVLWALAQAHATTKLPEAAAPLAAVYREHQLRNPTVAAAAARAVGQIGGEGAVEVLLAASKHKEARVRAAAAGTLPLQGELGADSGRALRELLADPSSLVRRSAIRAIGAAKREAFVPDLIHLLENDVRLKNRYASFEALHSISSRDFSLDAAAWRAWWKDRTRADLAPDRKYTFARYYGFGVHSDRVLFVVDVSGSMNWSFHFKPKRIEVARRELGRVLGELSPDALFNVVVFAERVKSWHKGEVEATPSNVRKARKWAKRVLAEPEGETDTFAALETAFRLNPKFDTIYLLSDGYPTRGKLTSNEGLIAAVRSWNRGRGAELNTIALTLENVDRGHPHEFGSTLGEIKAFMRDLAAANGGKCKSIENAPP